MSATTPHYLMLSTSDSSNTDQAGQWRFVLEALEGDERLDIRAAEPGVNGERLELLSVLRGLESLDQPSRVTLVTPSRYVIRGIRFGLENWKHNQWHWENHDEMVPVKDHDLWQRLDVAMQIHDVRLRHWNAEIGHDRRLAESPITAHHDEYTTAVAG